MRENSREVGEGRPLLAGMSALLALDLAGGALAIVTRVNTPAEAWSGKAVLAAPLPMIAAQVGLTAVALRFPGRPGGVAAGLLAAACSVSGISGFFDGQLGRRGLTAPLVGFQVLLIGVTVLVGALAAVRSVRVLRNAGAR
jgi:hypothetical protein